MTFLELQSSFLRLLALGVFPLWLAAGFGDWLCHRRAGIERTSGVPESMLHVFLFALIALPIILSLFFELTAALLGVATAGVLTHSVLSWWDTLYTQPRRYIGPFEQIIHSHLEMLPVFGLAILIVIFWGELRAPQWSLVTRTIPLPRAAVLTTFAALFLAFALILEELARCYYARVIEAQPVQPS